MDGFYIQNSRSHQFVGTDDFLKYMKEGKLCFVQIVVKN